MSASNAFLRRLFGCVHVVSRGLKGRCEYCSSNMSFPPCTVHRPLYTTVWAALKYMAISTDVYQATSKLMPRDGSEVDPEHIIISTNVWHLILLTHVKFFKSGPRGWNATPLQSLSEAHLSTTHTLPKLSSWKIIDASKEIFPFKLDASKEHKWRGRTTRVQLLCLY